MDTFKKDFSIYIGSLLGKRWLVLQQNMATKSTRNQVKRPKKPRNGGASHK